jgi:hypothetical protein
LLVTGTATLGGTLDVLLEGAFDPTHGESFILLTSTGTLSGEFASLELPGAPGDWSESYYSTGCPTYGGGCFDLTYEGGALPPPHVPEPSIFLLLAMGIGAMTFLLKYRNTVRSAQ